MSINVYFQTIDVDLIQDLVFGYSHFWHGSFYDTNPAVPYRGDADFFYTQYTINF